MEPLYLFYEEPDPDRWLPGDRHPRRLIRNLVRGRPQPGGVMRWFLNLQAGLDRLGTPYRLNNYSGLRRHPGAWAHVIGKPHVIDKIPAGHPIVYGPGVAAHPFENDFWQRPDLRLVLLSCDWFKAMYDADLPRPIPTAVWPAGVETHLWQPPARPPAPNSFLIYDKIRWRRDHFEPALLTPVMETLRSAGLQVHHLKYGSYREEDYRRVLQEVSGMIFLCEHETQGFAYLQALSSGVPILAWNRGGFWQDPSMYPERVRFAPVSAVPYFDERCGETFADLEAFRSQWPRFLERVRTGYYHPRDYVTEHFDLARQAQAYLDLSAKARRHA
ncbi:MAG: glycosyltransferase family 1 protein [Verrucomicrobiota bacterium]